MGIPAPLLEAAESLLPALDAIAAAGIHDAWLGAGALRNRVWQRRYGGRLPNTDWDGAFSGPMSSAEATARLSEQLPLNWEAVNQQDYGHASAAHGLAGWPETATGIGVRLADGELQVLAPWGFDDLLGGVLRPSPRVDPTVFDERLRSKDWRVRWPALRVGALRAGQPNLEPVSVPFSYSAIRDPRWRSVIPDAFLDVHYDGAVHPGVPPHTLARGANCQVYAYALLEHHGLAPPRLPSRELWSDTAHCRVVADLEPLDLVLLNRTHDAFGAHVAVALGDGHAVHLARHWGRPVVERLAVMQRRPAYEVCIGAKRCN